jgi:guanosine-3',5'-bis(diphosphate) 3'-pyrophosphohydrolase
MNDLYSLFEEGVRLLSQYMPNEKELVKPTLFHSIRVGVYLYENEYPTDVVIAGLLHDIIEDTKIPEDLVQRKFGNNVFKLIKINSYDTNDPTRNSEKLIQKCIDSGEDATIIKAADIMDNISYHHKTNKYEYLHKAMSNAKILLSNIPKNFEDKIFEELAKLHSLVLKYTT